uniref:Uncharacterized protein n=1 Tax=Octopus bimaculoides TaxID=37653 RepID=A0A0L8HIB2_OCTBM
MKKNELHVVLKIYLNSSSDFLREHSVKIPENDNSIPRISLANLPQKQKRGDIIIVTIMIILIFSKSHF